MGRKTISVRTGGSRFEGRRDLRAAERKGTGGRRLSCRSSQDPCVVQSIWRSVFINDNVEIAIKCNADGIHVGQEDMQAAQVRQRVGSGMMIGVSVHSVEEALEAVRNGADCLGVGAVFSTSTKTDVRVLPRKPFVIFALR